MTTDVTNEDNPDYGTNGGNDTTDKVFLLSISEVEKYFSSNSARQCKPTAYAFKQGAWKSNSGNCWWWLRSPGRYSINAAFVDYSGDVGSDGFYVDYAGDVYSVGLTVDDNDGAVRPALWINLES